MNLIKSYEFFQPQMLDGARCHIIGCGSVGSTVAELLARFGIKKISLYDFDTVEDRNIVNQMFFADDVGKMKVDAVRDLICRINPDAESEIKTYPEGFDNKSLLSGYVFLCVDNIDLRREIAMKNKFNTRVKAMFDFRTALLSAQHYAANWESLESKEDFISTMDFTHDEATETNEQSACGVALSVAPTVRTICGLGVANFINFVKDGNLKSTIIADSWAFNVAVMDDLSNGNV